LGLGVVVAWTLQVSTIILLLDPIQHQKTAFLLSFQEPEKSLLHEDMIFPKIITELEIFRGLYPSGYNAGEKNGIMLLQQPKSSMRKHAAGLPISREIPSTWRVLLLRFRYKTVGAVVPLSCIQSSVKKRPFWALSS